MDWNFVAPRLNISSLAGFRSCSVQWALQHFCIIRNKKQRFKGTSGNSKSFLISMSKNVFAKISDWAKVMFSLQIDIKYYCYWNNGMQNAEYAHSSLIHLQSMLYPGQSCGGFQSYPGNTGCMMEMHQGQDYPVHYSVMHLQYHKAITM